jgi:hypothetical protein
MTNIDDEYWDLYGVKTLVGDLSPDIGETMRDLLSIYKRHYKKADLRSTLISEWVRESLTIIIKEHSCYRALEDRDGISDAKKLQILIKLQAHLFKLGNEWVEENT